MAVAVIVGSSFNVAAAHDVTRDLQELHIKTEYGDATVFKSGASYVLFRHGFPSHTLLPHQVNYRANIAALHSLGVRVLLVTSSVGVLDDSIDVLTARFVADFIMPSNTLPDGSACTMFVRPVEGQGHLVIPSTGLMHRGVESELLRALCAAGRDDLCTQLQRDRVLFAYVPGPRTKTPAENRFWRALGAQVNSQTLAPEVVLASELGMAVTAVVVGHKASRGDGEASPVQSGDSDPLRLGAAGLVMEAVVSAWLRHASADAVTPPGSIAALYTFPAASAGVPATHTC